LDLAQTIKILSENLANKIAAGEVIQRPASAVKELIENAIDAHTRSITIVIKDGGKSLIQIVDDGDGMSKEDAVVAFHRHATSKISTYEDLENIRTLGFRGEALASIAAVAQVEIRTRTRASDIGINIRIDSGIVVETAEGATAVGTSIQVKNLFFNTPARRNFLKSDPTEFKHIIDVVQRIALSHPEIAVKFISDDELVLDLKSTDIHDRVKGIFGEKLAQALIYLDEKNELMEIRGYLGKPEFSRKGRAEQYLFLNGRYIVNRNINHAVFQGYEHILEKGSFPIFILFLTLDPRKVDVNVHPTKMEVKFENEGSIYKIILAAIRKTLSHHDLIPKVEIKETISDGEKLGSQFRSRLANTNQAEVNWKELLSPATPLEKLSQESTRSSGFPSTNAKTEDSFGEPTAGIESCLDQLQEKTEPMVSSINDFPVWQLHNKYIVVQVESGIMIVDQHAAHERILYEQVSERFNRSDSKSQQLLFPHTIQLTVTDSALVKQLIQLLDKLGFSLKLFGNTTVILDGVPIDIKPGEEGKILQDILDLYKDDEQNPKIEPRERLAKSYACKAAIKSGDSLNSDEMRSLIRQLFDSKVSLVCPHGRPVIIKLSLSELDRRFGRTS
jgi:DNA mismatch repair protein MutL